MYRSSLPVALAFAAGLGVVGAGCHKDSDVKRRASDEATAEAEQKAQEASEASLTSATVEAADAAQQADEEALRARGEMIAAFRLEQSDYRGRLQHALDQLDKALVRSRASRGDVRVTELRARRDLLKADLDAVARATEPDWATLRTKVERDLESARPGTQLSPRTE
jgi:uncharacterized protein HemX